MTASGATEGKCSIDATCYTSIGTEVGTTAPAKCELCYLKDFLTTTTCAACSATNCLVCASATTCARCFNGYFINDAKTTCT